MPGRIDKSLITLGLGALVVIVVGLSVFNYFSRINRSEISNEAKQTTQSQNVTPESKPQPTQGEDKFAYKPTNLPTKYTVTADDHLWGIAQRYYNSGYNWVDIARENNLANPNAIHVGDELTIPKVEARIPTVQTAQAQLPSTGISSQQNQLTVSTDQQISGNSYTVKTGDNLWTIAERAYNDGYKWVQIANTNKLADPNLIHSGNVFNIPR